MDNAATTAPTVIVYSSPTCGFCHMAMDYLADKGVAFTEKDISVDQEALRFVLDKIGQAVTPIIAIGDQIIVGFDRPKIDDALQESAKK
jgi:glutaredoxin 3